MKSAPSLTVRTDNGYESQALFRWHVEDLGLLHVYIKLRSLCLNGKVERSHLIDDKEFCQLLTYTDDVDLHKTNGRVGGFLQLSATARRTRRKNPLRSAPGKTTMIMKTVSDQGRFITVGIYKEPSIALE